MNGFTATFLAALAISVALQTWLAMRQVAHVRAHRSSVPSPFRDRVPLEVHQKAADYTVAKTQLIIAAAVVDVAVLLAWTLGGGLDQLDRAWRALNLTPAAAGAGVVVSALLLTALLRLPLFAYSLFVIEERFGFNRLTTTLFLTDTIKKGLLLVAVTAPLAAVVVWLMENTGGLWWLYVWTVWTVFVLARMWAYPTLVAPLFNRFTLLRDEGLRTRIAGLLERCGLVLDRVFVMDGSRRSSHGNAYVSGLGGGKRIVLLDTLLDALDPEEIEAVLAHEVGHVKRRHLPRYLAATSLVSLGALLLLDGLAGRLEFYQGLGVSHPSSHAALALFLLAWPVFGVFLKPPASAVLRRFEFEADAFAAKHGDPQALIRALVKLYRANASSLTPDPLYSTFHHSHPPPLARIEGLVGAPGNREI
jgi:STE24 endopeptidase